MSLMAKRIKNARLMRGWSLQDLADHMQLQISRQALHKYEKGEVEPDQEMVLLLAKALEMPVDYFYRKQRVEMDTISFRKLASFSKKKQARVIEQARDMLERYLELEEILGLEHNVNNPVSDIVMRSFEDAERAAEKLRKAWDLGSDPLFNILELMEDHGIKILELDSELELNGFSTWVSGSIPVMVLNERLQEHLDRYRFTALHELGHLFLNLGNIPKKKKEKFCNHFAGAMLFPGEAVEKELLMKRNKISLHELKAIKEQYGISAQAVMYRLRVLEVISEAVFREFMQFISDRGWKKDERQLAKYEGVEKALRFDQLIGRAIAEEYITVSKGAALKNQRLSEFRKAYAI